MGALSGIKIGENNNYDSSHPYRNTGNFNIAIGCNSLPENTSGTANIAMGWRTMSSNRTGSGNTAIGHYSLFNLVEGSYNTILGYQAGLNNNGERNTYIGTRAGYISDDAVVTNDYNTAIGDHSCTGVTGDNVTCLGAYSGPYYNYKNDNKNLDNASSLRSTNNAVYIGTKNDTVYIPGTIDIYNGIKLRGSTINLFSDARLKYVGKENTDGLDKIKQLKVFNYTFKKDTKKEQHVGVIAQDLQKIFPNAVKKGSDGYLMIRMEDMFYALINAVKQLDKKVTELIQTVQNDKKEIQQLKKENAELKARLDKLEAKMAH